MQVIYSNQFTSPVRDAPEVVTTGQTIHEIDITSSVTGFALFDTVLSDLTVEASQNDFQTTVFSQNLIDVSASVLIAVDPAVPAAKWRVKANANGTVGQFYVGSLITISNPVYPYGFDSSVFAEDRMTIGGIGYSRVRYQARSGEWRWQLIPETEISNWQTWYQTTSGFRLSFVLTDPVDSTPYLVKGSGEFPLTLNDYQSYDGEIPLQEVL